MPLVLDMEIQVILDTVKVYPVSHDALAITPGRKGWELYVTSPLQRLIGSHMGTVWKKFTDY